MPKVRHYCPFEGCSQSFSRKADVIRHLDIHDPETKYRFKCTYAGCTKTDRQKGNITTHVRDVHGVDNSSQRRRPTSKKERGHSSRSVDRFEGIGEITKGFNSFAMQSTEPSEGYTTQPWMKAEEEPNWFYPVDDVSTPSTSYVPELSPSGSSSSSSTSTPSPSTPAPTVPYPTTAYPAPISIDPIPTQSFDFSADLQYPQFLSTSLYNYYIGYCTEQLCAATNQQDANAVQYWYACLGAVVEAYAVPEPYGVPEPMPAPDQIPAEDMYYNVPGWGQPEPEPFVESFEEPFVQPDPIDYSTFGFSGDVNYFDASWSAAVPMNNFEALYGLGF